MVKLNLFKIIIYYYCTKPMTIKYILTNSILLNNSSHIVINFFKKTAEKLSIIVY